jgi:hypothetical protein
MDCVQAPAQPLVDRSSPDSPREQLPPRDHPVLPFPQPRNDPICITRAAFAPNGVVNAARVAGTFDHAAMVGRLLARVTR